MSQRSTQRNRKTQRRRGKPRRSQRSQVVHPLVSAQNRPSSWIRPQALPEQDILFEEIWVGTITTAAPQLVKRFNPNSLYTPEVGGASGSIPGFSYYSAIYNANRVVKYAYTIEVSNLEAFAVDAYIINNAVSFATNSTVRTSTAPFSQSHLLSPKGGQDRKIFSKTIHVAALVGREQEVEADDTYAGSFSSSPADVVWLGIGCQSTTGANITNGMAYTMRLKMYTRVYEPRVFI